MPRRFGRVSRGPIMLRFRIRTLMIVVMVAAVLSALEVRRENLTPRASCNCLLKPIRVSVVPWVPTSTDGAPAAE